MSKVMNHLILFARGSMKQLRNDTYIVYIDV